jgi:hypothetical protein
MEIAKPFAHLHLKWMKTARNQWASQCVIIRKIVKQYVMQMEIVKQYVQQDKIHLQVAVVQIVQPILRATALLVAASSKNYSLVLKVS